MQQPRDFVNGGANTSSRIRSAGHGAKWEIGFAQLEGNLLEWDAELFGRDLRECSVCARAEIVGRALDRRPAIRTQLHFCLGIHFVGGISGGRHAPTDKQVALAHRSRLRIALGPAEFFRAQRIAFL